MKLDQYSFHFTALYWPHITPGASVQVGRFT